MSKSIFYLEHDLIFLKHQSSLGDFPLYTNYRLRATPAKPLKQIVKHLLGKKCKMSPPTALLFILIILAPRIHSIFSLKFPCRTFFPNLLSTRSSGCFPLFFFFASHTACAWLKDWKSAG
jgi:hypothetical protein